MNEKPNTNIVMYTTDDGLTKVEATFDNDTVWLSIDQMAELFQRDRSVIGKHVRNVFKEGELVKEAVWAKFAYTASDGKEYKVDYYNLDVIISVGYRVKSVRGIQFRIWATGILKEYMKILFCLLAIGNYSKMVDLSATNKQSKKRKLNIVNIKKRLLPQWDKHLLLANKVAPQKL
ncbi:MAG: RhuM family protein [Hespellia sp.]|nr:RhuM family protein [Hespellia sp.]